MLRHSLSVTQEKADRGGACNASIECTQFQQASGNTGFCVRCSSLDTGAAPAAGDEADFQLGVVALLCVRDLRDDGGGAEGAVD